MRGFWKKLQRCIALASKDFTIITDLKGGVLCLFTFKREMGRGGAPVLVQRRKIESVGAGGVTEGEWDDDMERDLREVFDVFDGNGDGLMTVDELGLVLSSMGLNQGVGIQDCREMIQKKVENSEEEVSSHLIPLILNIILSLLFQEIDYQEVQAHMIFYLYWSGLQII